MERTKSPSRSLKRKKQKPGPKTSCTDDVIQEAYNLCLLGLTNQQLAEHFGKHPDTIGYWYRNYPKFEQAVDRGRQHADGKAAKRLYEIGMGYYEQQAVKFFKIPVTEKEYDEDGNVVKEKSYQRIKKVTYTKKFKPDRKALEKFLGVRNRRTWGQADKVEHKHAHMHAGGQNILNILEQIGDTQQYSDAELQAIAKLGLSEKAEQITNGEHNDGRGI